MKRAKIAAVLLVVCGLAVAGVGAARGRLWRAGPVHDPGAGRLERQTNVRNAARAVAAMARAAAEPPAQDVNSPAPAARPAEPAAAGADRPAPDLRWTVNARRPDATPNDRVPCGGKLCAADQFCCGPPECGHCASRMTGPRCPSTCP